MIKRGKDDFPKYEHFLGIDEVGYGSAAGPLVLCGVILPNEVRSELLIDSKKLNDPKKAQAMTFLEGKCKFYLANASVKFINKNGITLAIKKCVEEIVTHFEGEYDLVLMDGVKWYGKPETNHVCVPKGDNTYQEIASASIIAKVKRDEYMVKLDSIANGYSFNANKGYLSETHRNALVELGVSNYHRTQYVETWLKKKR